MVQVEQGHAPTDAADFVDPTTEVIEQDSQEGEGQLDLESAENRAQVVRQFAVKEAAERIAMEENTLDAIIAAEGPGSSLMNTLEGRTLSEKCRARVDKTIDDIRSGERPIEPAPEDYDYAQEKVDNIYALLSNEKRGVVRRFLSGLIIGALERNATSIAGKRRKTIEEGDRSVEQSRVMD